LTPNIEHGSSDSIERLEKRRAEELGDACLRLLCHDARRNPVASQTGWQRAAQGLDNAPGHSRYAGTWTHCRRPMTAHQRIYVTARIASRPQGAHRVGDEPLRTAERSFSAVSSSTTIDECVYNPRDGAEIAARYASLS